MLSCYSVRTYELMDFLSSKSACQLLAEFPLKRKGLPSLEAGFLHLQKQGTSQTHSGAVFHHEKCEKYLFYRKFRPLNSRGEESSQPSLYPSLLPLLIAFLLVTLEKFCSAERLCKYQRGHCQRQTWRHQRDHQERFFSTEGCTSRYALPGLLVPDVSWEQRVQGMNPREIKYSKKQILGKCLDAINHGAFRKLILNDVIKIAHERSVNIT